MPLKYNVFEKNMENGEFAPLQTPFSIIYSKVFKTLLIFSCFLQCHLKKENYVMI